MDLCLRFPLKKVFSIPKVSRKTLIKKTAFLWELLCALVCKFLNLPDLYLQLIIAGVRTGFCALPH